MARGNCRQAAAREDWQIDDAAEGWEASHSMFGLAELITAIATSGVSIVTHFKCIQNAVAAARARAIQSAVGLRRCRRRIRISDAVIALFAGIDLIVATHGVTDDAHAVDALLARSALRRAGA